MIVKEYKEINEDNNDNENESNDEINDEEDDKDDLTNDNDYYKGNMGYLTKSSIMNKYLTFTDENYVLNSINNQNMANVKIVKKKCLFYFLKV